MDTIRSYLESMFKNLPLTDKVMRAKSELLQMMEDKYTELIKEGKSENEAVGIVISEFGKGIAVPVKFKNNVEKFHRID